MRVENENKKDRHVSRKERNEIQVQYRCLCEGEAKKISLPVHVTFGIVM